MAEPATARIIPSFEPQDSLFFAMRTQFITQGGELQISEFSASI
jgi:hypothetical protein